MKHLELMFGAGLVLALGAAKACERLPLLAPAAGERLEQAQPELRWADGGPVRVQVAVLLPEARVLQAYDGVVTGGRWRLPQPVPTARAALKVLLSRGCERLDAQDLAAQGPAFFIDTAAACALPAGAFRWQGERLVWPAVPQASHYRLRAFDLARWAPGAPVAAAAGAGTDTVSEPEWRWVRQDSEPGALAALAVVWQAVCEGRAGEAVVLNPPSP